MPTKRAAPAVAGIGNKIVAVGGVSESQAPLEAIEIYDLTEKKWTAADPLGEKLLGISCIFRENKAYFMGGMSADTNPSDLFVELDLATNKWQKLTPLLTPRYATFPFLIQDKLYLLGGRQGKIPTTACEVYDFSTKKWSKFQDIPSKRVFAMYAASDSHIFSVGGLLQPASDGFSDVCEVFSIEKEEWTTCKPMPTKRGDFAVGIIGGKMICAGGLGNDGKPLNTTEAFDVSSNTWTSLADMPSSHCSCSYITYQGRLYFDNKLYLTSSILFLNFIVNTVNIELYFIK
ncbi:Kelch domain-containing protein 8B [Bulinus truncatus]|nr:Kelch domain-containing protein 8B [Bulinus truncatus]